MPQHCRTGRARRGESELFGVAEEFNEAGLYAEFWSLQGLSNAVENGGHLGSTADERLASLNLENVSPKEGVGGSIPSGAAILNFDSAEP
ncbi:hypothetical protein CCB80_08940 [Armatimonadetes bacterium Uphvl-Ar1]|nr:hypothetical protein CCB80_08940 [Armatimonadetes bacterium Uphvl-Ar1]